MHKTTVFEVVGYDGANQEVYFYPSSVKAHEKTREMRADNYDSITITPKQITLNATGVAMALQHIVNRFCINEH